MEYDDRKIYLDPLEQDMLCSTEEVFPRSAVETLYFRALDRLHLAEDSEADVLMSLVRGLSKLYTEDTVNQFKSKIHNHSECPSLSTDAFTYRLAIRGRVSN